MRTESNFSQALIRQLKKHKIPHQRIEATTGSGIPDLCVFFEGETIWLELKAKTYRIRAEQVVFARRAATQGVIVYSLIGRGEKNGTEDEITHLELFKTYEAVPAGKGWKQEKEKAIATGPIEIMEVLKYITE